jgi:hypothetical protein
MRRFCCAAIAMALSAAGSAGTWADTVGVDAVVNPRAIGTPVNGLPRALEVGQPIEFNERIATTETGRTQILFRDQSTVSVGPASEITIDQFLYEPNAGLGKLTMSTTRGVFRFVGGEVSKLENAVTLQTPSGTIGIRGGIFLASLSGNGELDVLFIYGTELTVTGRNGVVTRLRRPGYAVSVGGDFGESPSPPYPVPRGLLGGVVGQFQGPPLPPSMTTAAATITDAQVAAQPLFGQLAGEAAAATRNPPPSSPGNPGLAPPRASLGSLIQSQMLGIGSVAPQGDAGLRRATQ